MGGIKKRKSEKRLKRRIKAYEDLIHENPRWEKSLYQTRE